MNLENLAVNIKRLRRGRLTQNQLAKAAGLSLHAVQKLENGKAAPQEGTLQAVADALDVSPCEFFAPVRAWHTLRFRSGKSFVAREKLLADLARWLDDYNQLEQLSGAEAPFRLEGLANEANPLTPASLAAWCRERLGLDANEPVLDICGLLEGAGVKVLCLDNAPDSFFGLSVGKRDGGPAVAIRAHGVTVERQVFSAVHELGHILLHPDTYDAEIKDEDRQEELEADMFAGHFLMPSFAFKRKWSGTAGLPFVERVMSAKHFFKVSYKTVLYRLVEEGIKGKDVYGYFADKYRESRGRSLRKNWEPEQMEQSCFSPVRLPRLVYRAIEKNDISLSRGAEILRISVLDMRERMQG